MPKRFVAADLPSTSIAELGSHSTGAAPGMRLTQQCQMHLTLRQPTVASSGFGWIKIEIRCVGYVRCLRNPMAVVTCWERQVHRRSASLVSVASRSVAVHLATNPVERAVLRGSSRQRGWATVYSAERPHQEPRPWASIVGEPTIR